MKYGSMFGALAVLLAWTAATTQQTVHALLSGYGALSSALLAVAYLGRWPRLLGKECASGKLSVWSLIVLGPYHLLNFVLLRVVRHLGIVRGPVEVAPNLWLGPRLLRADPARLPEFSAIIDLCAELAEESALQQHAGYRCFAVLDATPPRPSQLHAAIDAAMNAIESGPVYIHCASGHGRSALVAAGVLLRQGNATSVDEAIAILRAKRPGVNPTRAQREVLEKLTKSDHR